MPRGVRPNFSHTSRRFLGARADHLHGFLAHAVVFHHGLGQFAGDGQRLFVFCRHAVLFGQSPELGFVADLVSDGAAVGHAGQHLHQVPAVVGVGGGAGGNHAAQVAGHDDVGIGTADTGLGPLTERIHPARPHDADAAGKAHVAETALGLLSLVPLPHGFDTVLLCFGKKPIAILGDRQTLSGIKHGVLLDVASAAAELQFRLFDGLQQGNTGRYGRLVRIR